MSAAEPSAPSQRAPLLNAGHALDHLIMLIYPTAVLAISREWGLSYAELLPLSLGGFIAFGLFAVPAGWIADRWSRDGMMVVFFFGSGAACLLASAAQTPWQLAAALTVIGVFAAIYHPVAPSLLVSDLSRAGRRLGFNGFCGNLGVASAALIAGVLSDFVSWRAAFALPGAAALLLGAAYLTRHPAQRERPRQAPAPFALAIGGESARLFAVFFVIALMGGLIFSVTTISMPKIFAATLPGLAGSTAGAGFFVFAVIFFAGLAQLIVGPLIDRFPVKRVLLAVIALQIPFLCLSGMAQGWALVAASAFMMFGVFGQIPVQDALIARYAPEARRSQAYALRYLVSFMASAAAVPFAASLQFDADGIQELFTALTGFSALAFIAALALPQTARGASRQAHVNVKTAPAE